MTPAFWTLNLLLSAFLCLDKKKKKRHSPLVLTFALARVGMEEEGNSSGSMSFAVKIQTYRCNPSSFPNLLLLFFLFAFFLCFTHQYISHDRRAYNKMDNSSLNFYETRPDPTPPPPGVEPNFNGTNTNGNVFIIVAVVGIVLATISSAMRVYTKALLTRSFGIDDSECFFPFLLSILSPWAGG